MSFQTTFIEVLKTKLPKHISLVDELSELLSISKDSAYRRLRDETPLTLDEAVQISLHFDISPAALLEQATELIPFKYNKLYGESGSFKLYIQQMTALISAVNKAGGEIIYAAEDIPIFHHFRYPKLACFKIFYWSKSVLDLEAFNGKKFDDSMIHPEIMEAAEELHKVYCKSKSTEIWAYESINSTLRQIEYYASSYQFNSKEEALNIVEELSDLIAHIEKQAEQGNKLFDQGGSEQNYKLFDSEVLIGNNTILIKGLPKPVIFISHNTFNSLSTRDKAFYEETSHWMDNLLKRSTQISGASEKFRFRFFKRLNNSIAQSKEKIEQMEF